MVTKITVKLLGEFSVRADNVDIVKNASKLTKPWQLFVYLLMKNGDAASGEELLRVLWDEEELIDPANVLKNTIFALRRELSGKDKPHDSPILFSKGGYCINPSTRFSTDTKHFSSLCAKAQNTEPEHKAEALRASVAAYSGDFLPMLDGEAWTITYSRQLKELYVQNTLCLCDILNKQGLWNELLSVAAKLNLVAPLREEGYLYTFRALEHLQMFKAIVTSYNKTSRFFEEELNMPLCDEIRRIHLNAAQRVNKTDQDILIIRDDLQTTLRAQQAGGGAMFCNYEAFKRMFLLLQRAAMRNKGVVDIVLITIQDFKGHTPAPQVLLTAMTELKAVIANHLRKSDTCCRYSRCQYALLMLNEKKANANSAIERVVQSFSTTKSGARLELSCKITSIEENTL